MREDTCLKEEQYMSVTPVKDDGNLQLAQNVFVSTVVIKVYMCEGIYLLLLHPNCVGGRFICVPKARQL